MWYLSFWDRSISPGAVPSGFLHVVACDKTSFFFIKAEKYFTVCICLIFFIHPSINRYLDCFYLLAVVNMDMQISDTFSVLLDIYSEV